MSELPWPAPARTRTALLVCGIGIILLVVSNLWLYMELCRVESEVNALKAEKDFLLNDLLAKLGNLNGTNGPSEKTDFEILDLGNFHISSGKMSQFEVPDWNNPVFVGGYDKVSIFYEIYDLSPGNYNLTIWLKGIAWFSSERGTILHETINALRMNITREDGTFHSHYVEPVIVETKGPYFSASFSTDTTSPEWSSIWVVIRVRLYLRND